MRPWSFRLPTTPCFAETAQTHRSIQRCIVCITFELVGFFSTTENLSISKPLNAHQTLDSNISCQHEVHFFNRALSGRKVTWNRPSRPRRCKYLYGGDLGEMQTVCNVVTNLVLKRQLRRAHAPVKRCGVCLIGSEAEFRGEGVEQVGSLFVQGGRHRAQDFPSPRSVLFPHESLPSITAGRMSLRSPLTQRLLSLILIKLVFSFGV